MKLVEKNEGTVTVSFTRVEFGTVFELLTEMYHQWHKIDEAAFSVTDNEAKDVIDKLRVISKAPNGSNPQNNRSAA